MTGTEIALIITASGTLITAAGGVFIALTSRKTAQVTQQTAAATAEVHTIVNQQRTDDLRYRAVLLQLLKKSGIPIPDDQSLLATTQERTD